MVQMVAAQIEILNEGQNLYWEWTPLQKARGRNSVNKMLYCWLLIWWNLQSQSGCPTSRGSSAGALMDASSKYLSAMGREHNEMKDQCKILYRKPMKMPECSLLVEVVVMSTVV